MATETEIRGKLDKTGFLKIFKRLQKSGKLYKHYKRISVDFSSGFNTQTKSWEKGSSIDLRLKKSDREEKITLKIGELHLKKRTEIEVKLCEGNYLNVVRLFETLGFNKGMIYFSENWEFLYRDCEIKLSKFNDDCYNWEIESKTNLSDLEEVASDFDLVPLSKDEYYKLYYRQNQNVHKLYSYELVKKLLQRF